MYQLAVTTDNNHFVSVMFSSGLGFHVDDTYHLNIQQLKHTK